MSAMSMNTAIHNAFRRDLDRFRDALASLKENDSARIAQLRKAWANFHLQLTHHHEGEHDIAWPALKAVGVSAETIAAMDAEHDVLAKALDSADASFAALGAPGSVQAATVSLAALREAMITHLDHEEAELEQVYRAKRDTPEIKAMGKQFSKVPPKQGGVFMAWVQDGADSATMAGLKDNVPGPVLKLIPMIFGRSYYRDVAPAWR